MAADMNPIRYLPAFCMALCASGQTLGQALADPTRPPDTVRSAAAGEAPNAAPARLPAPPVVMLSGDRSQVTINGQTVRLGGRIGDSKVVRISDTEVVLQSATSTQTIRLYGAIDKKMIATGPQATKGARPGSTEAVK
jgi:MSHA biogenesis protein MshK